MLYQLPNGNHIEAKLVIAVRYFEREECSLTGNTYPHRVVVESCGGFQDCVEFETAEEAIRFRDEMARGANAASPEELAREVEEYRALFDLRWKADMRAVKRWQETTGKTLTFPDRADMVCWLLDNPGVIEELRKE